jgi:sugar/nucleoside kinase (ribokinase family)
VKAWPSEHTVYFENIYLENQDQRTQRVLQTADAFTIEQLAGIQASVFHLGPLLADDIPVELISTLSGKGMISLDVQGYLRKVRHEMVCAIDWVAKKDVLKHVDILKADENEMEIITGYADPRRSAKVLSDWGVKEVVITLGSRGSVIYKDHDFYDIPAYRPGTFVDATGCGDTYMAGYLYQRVRGAPIQDAGEFAAAMATLKIETSGPFTGTKEAVLELAIDDKRKMGSK